MKAGCWHQPLCGHLLSETRFGPAAHYLTPEHLYQSQRRQETDSDQCLLFLFSNVGGSRGTKGSRGSSRCSKKAADVAKEVEPAKAANTYVAVAATAAVDSVERQQ